MVIRADLTTKVFYEHNFAQLSLRAIELPYGDDDIEKLVFKEIKGTYSVLSY